MRFESCFHSIEGIDEGSGISGCVGVCVLDRGVDHVPPSSQKKDREGEQRESVFVVCAGGEAAFLATFL